MPPLAHGGFFADKDAFLHGKQGIELKKQEIEQKFTYRYLPYDELQFIQKTTVYRKYLSFDPEIRINKRCFEHEERYHLTIKEDALFERSKVKLKITKSEYEEIAETIHRPELIMDVVSFAFDAWHILNFKSCVNHPIRFAEMEYKDEEDYRRTSPLVQALPCIGNDVTYHPDYYSKNIWAKL